MSGATLIVDVLGTPRPQPRPRVLKNGRTVSTTGPAVIWKRLLLAGVREAMDAALWDAVVGCPVSLRLVSRMGTPEAKRWGRPVYIAGRGDADNLAKTWLDVMTARGVWGDDCQVAHLEQWQVWVEPGKAGATCEVRVMRDDVLPWARAAFGASGGGVVKGEGVEGAPAWLA